MYLNFCGRIMKALSVGQKFTITLRFDRKKKLLVLKVGQEAALENTYQLTCSVRPDQVLVQVPKLRSSLGIGFRAAMTGFARIYQDFSDQKVVAAVASVAAPQRCGCHCGGLACQKLAVTALIRYVTYSVSESEKALCGHNRPKKGHTYTDLSQDVCT